MPTIKCNDFALTRQELERRLRGDSIYGAAETFRAVNQIRAELGVSPARPGDRIEDTLSETEELLEARLRRRIN